MSFDLGELKARITADTTGLHRGLDKSNTLIARASGRIKGSLVSIKRSVFSLQSAFVMLAGGAGIGLITKSFLTAATRAEGFRVRLDTLLGSVIEGGRAFKEMAQFAGEVPYKYEEIMQSATALAGIMRGGVDEIKRWMPMITDLAAVSGISLQETTGQIIRMYSAGAAAADMFRERGILAMMGFTAGVSYSAEETRKMMFKSWNAIDSKFRGVTQNLAKTWEGMMSMLGDAWFQFRNMVMDEGVFDFMKAGVGLLLDEIDKLKKEADLGDWTKAMSDKAIGAFETIIKGVGGVSDIFRGLEMTWLGLKLTYQSLIATMLSGAEALDRSALLWQKLFGTQEGIQKAQEELDGVRERQEEWSEAIDETVAKLEKLAGEESGLSKANKLIDTINTKLADLKLYDEVVNIGAAYEGFGAVPPPPPKPPPPEKYENWEALKTEKWYKELDKRWAAEEAFNAKVAEGARQLAEDQQTVREDFQAKYDIITMNKFDLERQRIHEQSEVYRQAGTDREMIAQYTSEKLIQIAASESQARYTFYAQAAGSIAGTFMQIAQAGGKQSKRAFKLYQAFAITQAYMSAAAAYVKTLAEPALPWPGNVAMAQIIAGMAAVQIAMIAAAQPPSYDTGGISTMPGVYYAGVPEAHIPLQNGAVPVTLNKAAGALEAHIPLQGGVVPVVLAGIKSSEIFRDETVRDRQLSEELTIYDLGGVSKSPQAYYAGIPEAHIPLVSGAVPVILTGAEKIAKSDNAPLFDKEGAPRAPVPYRPLLPEMQMTLRAGVTPDTLDVGELVKVVEESVQPPPVSYDAGGVSTRPGVYYSGVPEAHIPLQGGNVPVVLAGDSQSKTEVNIILENPTFQDLNTQREAFAQIAEIIVKRVAPGAIVKNYYDDGPIRSMVRGRE